MPGPEQCVTNRYVLDSISWKIDQWFIDKEADESCLFKTNIIKLLFT